MITVPAPEMLWETSDADTELPRRFGLDSADAAVRWTADLLADDFDLRLRTVDRIVISAQNLMVWVTADGDRRLMIKICRLAVAHDWLAARAAMVSWLADRGQPVARPIESRTGDHQLLRSGLTVGAQPVLAGDLLDGADHDQVRSAGHTLAALHTDLAEWPDVARLAHAGAVQQGGRGVLWALPEGRLEALPRRQQDRWRQRIAELPELTERQPTHTDFRGANLLCRDGRVSGVIDFEEARLDRAVADVAHAVCLLGTWYHGWQPISAEAQQVLINSYAELRPLTDTERAWLPVLVAWGMLGPGWLDEAERWLDHP